MATRSEATATTAAAPPPPPRRVGGVLAGALAGGWAFAGAFTGGWAWALPAGSALAGVAGEPVAVEPGDAAGAALLAADADAAAGADAELDAVVSELAVGLDSAGTEEDDDASGSGDLAVIVVSLGATVERRYPVRSSLAG
jgi:hypothetical protein